MLLGHWRMSHDALLFHFYLGAWFTGLLLSWSGFASQQHRGADARLMTHRRNAAHISIPTSTCKSDGGQQKWTWGWAHLWAKPAFSSVCPTHSHRCSCSALKRARVRAPASRWFLTQLHERVGKRKISDAAHISHDGWFQASFQTGVGNYRWALEQTRLKENLVHERNKCATLGSHWTGEKVCAGFTPWFTTKVTGLDLFGCVWDGLGFPGNLPSPKTQNQMNRGG